jgi:hypothetical protein
MKLIKKIDSRLKLFDGEKFLELIFKTKKNETPTLGKYNVYFAPVIQCEKPTLINKGITNNEFELVVHNLMSEDDNNTDSKKVIVHSQSSFLFSFDGELSKRELFELVLKQTDELNTGHFFSYLDVLRNKLRELDPKVAQVFEKFEFSLLKLGTEYRPYPEINYNDFFD